jgi:hypothetical protein
MSDKKSAILVTWFIWGVAFAVILIVGYNIQAYLTFYNVPSGSISDSMRLDVFVTMWSSWAWIVGAAGMVVCIPVALWIDAH